MSQSPSKDVVSLEKEVDEAQAALPNGGTGLSSPPSKNHDMNGDHTNVELQLDDDADGKGLTFRKRRLSLTHLRQVTDGPKDKKQLEVDESLVEDKEATADPVDPNNQPEDDAASGSASAEDKAHSFRKRRLSLTHKREDASSLGSNEEALEEVEEERRGDIVIPLQGSGEPSPKRRRRGSADSTDTLDSQGRRPVTRTLHAGELLASHSAPQSPSAALYAGPAGGRSGSFDLTEPLPKLYQQAAPPQQQSQLTLLETALGGAQSAPRWKKRHTKHGKDDKALPFPRSVVGTFSCHGVEPVYDSDDYPEEEEEDDDDDDEDEEFVDDDENGASAFLLPGGIRSSSSSSRKQDGQEKPTMAAKINQDRGGVAFPYGNSAKTALFAVYDGHGQGGELISQFALHEVQRLLEKHPDFKEDIEKAFKETFLKVDASLGEECLIEPLYAGTTACVALLRGKKLILSNAGDSRAVLARRRRGMGENAGNDNDGPNFWKALELTQDQNPDLPEEQARIESMGGFVSPPPEPGLSARVWLDSDCTQIGLAMARSLGDHAVKRCGVIAEPVVSYHDVQDDDEFLILATDGVWEFVSSSEAVEIVANSLHKGATKACRALIEAAAARWHHEEGDYSDDITALVIRLQYLWTPSSPSSKLREEAVKE